MKQHTQSLNMCTVKSQTQNRNHFVIIIFMTFLASCAARQSPEPVSGVPEGPAAQQSLDPSMAALMQGLQYVREHPSSREDERIQRFLWLDQWLNVLQTKQRLTPELAQELWGDFTSFVKDEPAVSPSGLRKISEGSQTKLGKNVAHYYTYQGLLKERSLEDALKSLEIVEEDGVSDIYTKSQELLQLYKSKEFSDSRKIGVLLPLSGDLKPLADEVLSSIQIISSMAYTNGVEFVIQDVGSSEADLLKAWNHLVNVEKVAVVMGPLTPRESETIFERAEVSGVPVVSLAPKEGLEGFGQFGFRSVLTLEDQVRKVTKWIRETLKAKRVAIMVPDWPYGMDVLTVAKREFEAAGLEIRGLQVYPANATDFKEPLRRLVNLDIPRIRKDEVCPKNIAEAELPVGCVKNIKDLKPMVDFEVLFVPDAADNAGFLLPTLPYLRIYGVQVVGLSLYNSPRLMERAGDAAEGVVFTDGFVASAKDFQTRWFRDSFKKLTTREPSRLAAEAYDLGMILAKLIQDAAGIASREQIVGSLRSLKDFPGVTGKIYFDNNKLKKDPKLLIVRKGSFKEIDISSN